MGYQAAIISREVRLKMTSGCPTNIFDRLQTYFRREGRKEGLRYQAVLSTGGVEASFYYFEGLGQPTALVVIVANGEADWRKIQVSILTNDAKAQKLIEPICKQYEKDMYKYYCSEE